MWQWIGNPLRKGKGCIARFPKECSKREEEPDGREAGDSREEIGKIEEKLKRAEVHFGNRTRWHAVFFQGSHRPLDLSKEVISINQ